MCMNVRKIKEPFVSFDWNEFLVRLNAGLTSEEYTHLIDTIAKFIKRHSVKEIAICRFSGTNYYVTVKRKDYILFLNHIYNDILRNEHYELCSKIVELQKVEI
jgi:hypothetical protein